jgi:NAD(P)-dependent dehydrogenase (short-subunit alcohol dehydrogenase family)
MDQKVALVTGAATGIGAAVSRLFIEEGYAVVACARRAAPPAEELPPEGSEYTYRPCDVSDEEALKELIRWTDEKYGRIDVLSNNAGVVLIKPVDEVSWDEYRSTFDVKVGGTIMASKHVVPIMRRNGGGVIVNMASVSGHVGQIDHSVYGATNGAILALTRAMAWELAPSNIRVNSISPGSIDTPMLRNDIHLESERTGRSFEELKKEREAEQAFGRWADPREIATAISFLAGDASSFMTGADLLVDCGWVAK